MRPATLLAMASVVGLSCMSALQPPSTGVIGSSPRGLLMDEGTIIELGSDQLVFQSLDPEIDDIRFTITESTDFVERGAFIELDDVSAGEHVRVVYEMRDGTAPEAKRIEILSDDSSEGEPPTRVHL